MPLRKKLDNNGDQKTDKAGRLIWQVDYYEGGKRKRPEIKGSEEYALKVYAELLKLHSPAPNNLTKVKTLVPQFLSWYAGEQTSKKTLSDMINTFNSQVLPFFGDYAICQVDVDLVEKFKEKRTADPHQRNASKVTVSKRTVNKELSYFSSFLNYCEDKKIQRFDFRIKRHRKLKTPLPQPFSMAEIDILLKKISPNYRLPFLLMCDMGLRKTEALELKAEDVQGDVIHVMGKGSKQRVLSITSSRLKAEIEKAMQDHPEGHLTKNPRTKKPYTTMRKELDRVLKVVNIELKKNGASVINKPLRHHLLRHSFGTNAIKIKAFSLVELKEYMGHTSINTTMLYVTLAGDTLQAPAAKFGDHTVTKK
ncbi:tyrosine-type recombinase/integrase [Thermodesulfobacteriota bacterium]